jgi:RimJ/RimL family protein N-acetyltransferase
MSLVGKPATGENVFEQYIGELNALLTLRSVNLDTDAEMLINWAGQPYAKKFWQMNEPLHHWHETYRAIQANPDAHALLACIDEEPVAQIDVYSVNASELKEHVQASDNDAGLHLLMAPPRELQKGFAFYTLRSMQHYFFSFDTAGDLYAEPDHQNVHANRLAAATGFRFVKTITLAGKIANLFRLRREEFFK